MALLSEFYLSTPDAATMYDATRDTFTGPRHKFERITDVELSILWSILRDEEWDSDLLDHFEMVFEAGGGDRIIIQLPKEFIDTVVDLPVDLVGEAAEVWADTEELQCEPGDVQPVIEALATLGRNARDTQENVYLWICV